MNKITDAARSPFVLAILVTALLLSTLSATVIADEPIGRAIRSVQTFAIGQGPVEDNDEVLLGNEYAVGRYGTLTLLFNDESTLILTPGSRARIIADGTRKSRRYQMPSFVIQLNGSYRWMTQSPLSLGRVELVEDRSSFPPLSAEDYVRRPTRTGQITPDASQARLPAPAEQGTVTDLQASRPASAAPTPTEKPADMAVPSTREKATAANSRPEVSAPQPRSTPTAQKPAPKRVQSTPATASKTAPRDNTKTKPVPKASPEKVSAPAEETASTKRKVTSEPPPTRPASTVQVKTAPTKPAPAVEETTEKKALSKPRPSASASPPAQEPPAATEQSNAAVSSGVPDTSPSEPGTPAAEPPQVTPAADLDSTQQSRPEDAPDGEVPQGTAPAAS